MSWFEKLAPSIFGTKTESKIPAGIWLKCSECNEVLYDKELEKYLKVCQYCGFHFRLNCYERLKFLLDKNSFVEKDKDLSSKDPLNFTDTKKYKRFRKKSVCLKNEFKKANSQESVMNRKIV